MTIAKLLGGITIALALTSGTGFAITIIDLTDGLPVVDTERLQAPVTVVSLPEQTTITGHINELVMPFAILGDPRSVVLTEPAGDFNGPISDIITLTPGPITFFPPPFQEDFDQVITLTFISDSTGPLTAPLGAASIPESGLFQLLDGLLNSIVDGIPLGIAVKSDFGGGAEVPVPEPATWLLLGSGFVALAFARRKLAGSRPSGHGEGS